MKKVETPEHREARLEYLREWRRNNKPNRSEASKEKSKKRMREQYATDPVYREDKKAKTSQYRKDNPEKVKEANDNWLAKNKPQQRAYHRVYNFIRYNNDPVFRQRSLEAQSMWRLRNWQKMEEGSGWTKTVINKDIDKSLLRRLRVWQNGRCYICNQKSDRLTIEHLIPRSRGGPTISQNLVYSCPRCNFSRQHKILDIEWQPDFIEATSDDFTVVSPSISKVLDIEGFAFSNVDTYYQLTGPLATRNLYILSTFLSSTRNPGSFNGRVIKKILKDDTTAVVVLDTEWFGQQSAVLNLLRSKIGIAARSKGARQLQLMELSPKPSRLFLNEHHLMGNHTTLIRVGLIDGETIYGLGAFTDHNTHFECERLAFRGHVPGGMSRIIKYLWRTYERKPVISFVDQRYATGGGHETIGFEQLDKSPETYLWVLHDRVQHQRYFSNDNKMSRNLLYFNPECSKEANMIANGIHKLWLPPKLRLLLKP